MPAHIKEIDALAKKYGITIGGLGSSESIHADVIPTGILPLDMAIGIGGIPRGYFTEVYSPEGVGKTTLCLQVAASAQRLGLQVAYIDMEHRLDPSWAIKLGVDIEDMYFTQPPYGEAALNIVKALVKGGVELVIIDSVPALTPKSEWEGDTGDQFVGLLPRMLAQGMRQIVHDMKDNNASVVFINQVRARIGGMGSLAYGPQEITPGGHALKHNASLRIELRRIAMIQETSNGIKKPVGQRVKATTKKNSLSTPYKTVELVLRHGVGFDSVESIIDLGIKHGVIIQSGSWFAIGDQKVQGRSSVYDLLVTDTKLLNETESEIRGILGGKEDSIEYEDTEGES